MQNKKDLSNFGLTALYDAIKLTSDSYNKIRKDALDAKTNEYNAKLLATLGLEETTPDITARAIKQAEASLPDTTSLQKADISALITEWGQLRIKTGSSIPFFQQALAYIAATAKPEIVDGFYSPKKLFLDYIKEDKTLYALWYLFRHPSRSDLLFKQTTEDSIYFCSLVPLFLSAYKKYNNIQYSQWNRDEVHGLVEPTLTEAMLAGDSWLACCALGSDQLLASRASGLEVKSGAKLGQLRSPITTYTLYIPKTDKILEILPRNALFRSMLFQTWAAHPSHRNKYMILDPSDWDNIPEPLISTEPITNVKSNTAAKYYSDTPW